MQKIINDLLYDTEISELIYLEEGTQRRYYKTPNGNFFTLYPTGEIQPKSERDMRDYLGKYDVDKYIEIFGEPEEA